VHGKVTVKFTVNKEGRVVRAQATDGPEDLRKPVEENVMKWQFRPFLILDRPVEVESTTFYNIQ
jgi:outer membrane biosynthesis protein TonB